MCPKTVWLVQLMSLFAHVKVLYQNIMSYYFDFNLTKMLLIVLREVSCQTETDFIGMGSNSFTQLHLQLKNSN